ncbi:MFS transporter [Serratia bockelmannii]|jgi:MFS family permease|uniref:MFS transporter n=1 Tax=Serratia bockelmannii TaxID=2703793 RepID=A0ABT8LYQ7_9GAMM|nr:MULTISPECIES: MFS transporter [Serratia]ASM31918.1 MFS transporter [Serratia marcescens]EMB2735016.1 MFS transporter [Serratia marcescens]KAB1578861.1 MFS transporter [Serratia marcescens]MBH2626599.1 MFS transporter [Serratia marcescens]MBH2715567.1 MFS transporter [Serratia marcescens]
MSLYKKTTVNGWQPQQLTIRDAKFATWIAFFAWVFAVYDFILFGTLLPEIGDHFGWSEVEQAELATWVAVGGAIIALAIGPLVDKLGRRLGIVVTVGGAAVCSLLTAIGGAWGKGALIGIRSVAGLGYAEQTVNATYLTEIYAALDDPALNRRKGFIYSLVQGGWPVGALVASALTALLMPIIGWQGSFIFAALPSFIIALLALKLKETPQFQIHQHIHQLRHLGDIEQARQVARDYQVDYDAHQQAGLSAAFRGASLRATLVLGGAVLINWFAIQIFSVLGTTVLTKVHSVSFANSLLILVLSNLVGYCGYLTHGWLGDRFGRRNTIAVGWMIGGVSFAVMLFCPSNLPTIVALYSIGLFFLIGPYAAALFFISESFPTAIRATAGALIGAMGPIGAIIAGIGTTTVLSDGGHWQTAALWFGAVPCFASGVIMLFARHVAPHSVH